MLRVNDSFQRLSPATPRLSLSQFQKKIDDLKELERTLGKKYVCAV